MLMLARSLIANAQELQETWLKPALDSVLKGLDRKIELVEVVEHVQYLSDKELNIDN